MNARTREYLRGRFRDHYRRVDPDLPPDAHEREWGYIPWTEGPGTTMVRHESLLDLGDLGEFLREERPRHVYFSAGRYRDPSNRSMSDKGWTGSDLVFDLDADHLPGVDPEADSLKEMLAVCKDALRRLLSFLETDFGFEDLTVVFSGGRGYHVHVRDPGVRDLDRGHRREVVDYVRGNGLDSIDDVCDTEQVLASGHGRQSGTSNQLLRTDGGWGRRTHEHLMAFVDELRERDADSAKRRLEEFEGVGEKTAEQLYSAVTENYDQIRQGNVSVRDRFPRFAERFMERAIEAENAPIDEPVTTDINRLIRFPGSLHGGSGLAVTRLDRDALDDFDPLEDAVPETFRSHDITVEVTEPGTVDVGGDTFTLSEGVHSVPEYAGVFLMARGRAEKGEE